MTNSYLQISAPVARRLRLIMTDVDGTLTLDGEHFDPAVFRCISALQEGGIIVGLVSGRDLPRLEKIVSLLGIQGPLIAENGGVARLEPGGPLVDLGYSRKPALEAVAILKAAFPGAILELEDNKHRLVDVTISADGIDSHELQKRVPGMQVLDSGYMVHLMPEGISKGKTLISLVPRLGIGPKEVMVFGDSTTDISLFRVFENSVLIRNPRLSEQQAQAVLGSTAYESELPVEQGFCQVVEHILQFRRGAA